METTQTPQPETQHYRNYLVNRGYAAGTVKSNIGEVHHFKAWCKRKGETPEGITYKSMLNYIKYLTSKGNSKKTVNHKLGSLKHYFTYLIEEEGLRGDHPLENTEIKGIQRVLHYTLLEKEELEDLYYSYRTEGIKDAYHRLTAKRNKVIIGFMVYQGLGTRDLGMLRAEDLRLNKGKLYVPSTRKSNARELELKSWQMMGLMEYQSEIRPLLQKRINNYNEQLFPLNTRFTVITSGIIKKLRNYNRKVDNIKQLRASVITGWLKQYNLRKVQYLSGHRYISSTERYEQDDLARLEEMINQYHPIQ